jgi:HAD superfamily hydrolase (TIGR01509 family)
MLEAIIFDIGNVLLSFDFGRTFRRLAPQCGVSTSEVLSVLNRLKNPFESGRLGVDDFLKQVTSELGYRGDVAELRLAWQEIFEPIEQTHALVRRLHSQIPLYLLSNTNDLHTEYFLSRYSVFECFQDAIFSQRVGLLKPNPEIYRVAARRFSLRPENALFIDDLEENVESAAAVGLKTHQYNASRHEDLEKRLEEFEL